MTQEHPITPPPGLIKTWCASRIHEKQNVPLHVHVATKAARWGADQELEACVEWFSADRGYHHSVSADLRAARRPKPPSLREEALETLRSMQIEPCWINGINTNAELMSKYNILRRALESLPD